MVETNSKILEGLGITGNEAKAYAALCELGPSVASEVAEKAGIHRALTYATLARLVEKGLVSQVTKDRFRVFEAAPPARLEALFEEREKESKTELVELVSQLSTVYRVTAKPSVEVFTGLDGVKSVLSDELAESKKGGEILFYRAQPELVRLAAVAVAAYHRKRTEKGVRARALFDSAPLSSERAREFAKLGLSEVRTIGETAPTPITYHIYAQKVAILSVSKEEALGIVVKSSAVADFFRSSFESAWRKAKPLN